jgi:hypothetical protein
LAPPEAVIVTSVRTGEEEAWLDIPVLLVAPEAEIFTFVRRGEEALLTTT